MGSLAEEPKRGTTILSMFPKLDLSSNPPTQYEKFARYFGISGKSGFGSSTTTDNVLAKYGSIAKGKTVLVTGCSEGGLGFETAKAFAKAGSKVILNLRSEEKGDATLKRIKEEVDNADVHLMIFDLGKLETVRPALTLFEKAVGKETPLHILVNNAGIMGCPFTKTEDGIESQFAVCHVGHFALFDALLPKLKMGAADGHCRVVSLSSHGHRFLLTHDKTTIFDLEMINDEASYSPFGGYGRAKLSNILFAKEVERRYGSSDGIHAVSVHPGVIITPIGKYAAPDMYVPSIKTTITLTVFSLVRGTKSIPQGGATTVYCALAPEVTENYGGYFSDCNVGRVHEWGEDENLSKSLWTLTENLIHKTG